MRRFFPLLLLSIFVVGMISGWPVSAIVSDQLGASLQSNNVNWDSEPTAEELGDLAATISNDEENYGAALSTIEKAIKESPINGRLWYNKGIILMHLKRLDEALEALNYAIQMGDEADPGDRDAIKARDMIIKALNGGYSGTDSVTDSSNITNKEKQEEVDDLIWYNKAYELSEEGKYEEAIEALNNQLKITPDLIGVYYNKGVFLSNLGRYEEAVEVTKQGLKIDPSNGALLGHLGSFLQKLGKSDEALEAYKKGLESTNKQLEITPEDFFSWNRKATLL